MRSASFALVLLVSTAGRQQDPVPSAASNALVGDWQLNVGRSHYGAGVDRRRRERMTCTAESGSVHCVIRSARADGRELTGHFSASLDGVLAPVTGIPDVDQVRLRRPNAKLVDATFLSRSKPVFGYRAFKSDDGRSLMIMSVEPVTRAAATTVVVYDRR